MSRTPVLAKLGPPGEDDRWLLLARWAAGDDPGVLAAMVAGRAPDPHVLGELHAAGRLGDGLGAVYTPPHVARALVEAALSRATSAPTVLDPACGGGVFLLEAARILWATADARTPGARLRVLSRRVRGWDADPGAVRVSRLALAAAAGAPDAALDDVVVQRDALAGTPDDRFDVVVGNPPWVDAADQVASDPARRAALATQFSAAAGNWDLFCVFVERALAVLAPGGVHAFVVPDKLASAPYASVARRLLHGPDRDVVLVQDLDATGFAAAVRPLAYVSVPRGDAPTELAWGGRSTRLVLPRDGSPWPLPEDATADALLARFAGGPVLGDLADVRGAATVAEAYAVAEHLREGTPGDGLLPAVNSGTIDPLRSLWGERRLRYLGRSLLRPVLPLDALPPVRRDQATRPKVIVAGMTRRLEALADLGGRFAPLKSTTVVLPHREEDVAWLAGWLASTAATQLYRAWFGGLSFRGGYLRVGPPQLVALPVPDLDATTRRALAGVVEAAADHVPAALGAIDAIVTSRLGRAHGAAG